MTRRSPSSRDAALAVLAAFGVGVLWLALAIATGLIFHFLPGATFLAGAWTYRWRTRGARATWLHVAVVLVAAAVATAVALVALAAARRPLDSDVATAGIASIGALVTAVSLRWPGSRPDDPVTPEPATSSTFGTAGANHP
jgi:hypothetical protein